LWGFFTEHSTALLAAPGQKVFICRGVYDRVSSTKSKKFLVVKAAPSQKTIHIFREAIFHVLPTADEHTFFAPASPSSPQAAKNKRAVRRTRDASQPRVFFFFFAGVL
jgi:hypothetical protein